MANCVHGLPSYCCAICNRAELRREPFRGQKPDTDIRLRLRPAIRGGMIPRFERTVRYPERGVGHYSGGGSDAMRAAARQGNLYTGKWEPKSAWGRQSIADVLKSKI